MNFAGVTDSFATLLTTPNECPHCDATSRIAQGLCLSCLLQSGFDDAETDAAAEFTTTLESIAISDTHWRLGNYEILEEIGRGGMGVIYRARQRHSRRIVALKRILSYHADSRETLARFRREAEAAASLDHPNILPIYEVGESDEGVPYFSMKFAPGGSLQEVGPALRDDPREVVRLLAKVTRALQYAHRQGILHRDLKPGNVLLDGRGEPLVSDFGLAKWLDTASDLTRTLTIFGTPGYIVPEQAEGAAANLKPAADVYSLGAIMFDLLAGRPPFLGEHALAVIRQAAEKPAPKLRSLVKTADRDLETICARCLEREPGARYRSASDLAEDLECWLEGRPIVARPISPPVRLWRWSRRNPIAAGAAMSILLLGGTVAFVQSDRSHLARTVDQTIIFRRSVAVLPFLELETASPNSQFANSFAASLQRRLGRLGPARVVAFLNKDSLSAGLGTPDDVREVSGNAGTRTVLSGTVRQIDKKLSVSIRLIDAVSGETLLQRVFKTDISGSPGLELSALAANELSSALNRDQHFRGVERDPALRNKVASEYLRAGHDFEKRRGKMDFERALDCFKKAIDAEPSSALARADFAKAAVARFYITQASPELLTEAERLGREAVRLNPALPEARRALASLLYAEGDVSGSREQSLQAIELGGLTQGPVQSVANTTKVLGRPDLSLRWQRIAQVIQENPADYEFEMAGSWAALGEDARAEDIYRRVCALHPDLPEGWMGICELRLLEGDFEAARKVYREQLMAFSEFPAAKEMAAQVEFFSRNWPEAEKLCLELAQADPMGAMDYGIIPFQSALGRLRQVAGDTNEGQKILRRCLASAADAFRRAPQNPDALYRLAAVEASLGEREAALEHLRAAFHAGRLDYRSLRLDPRFDALRNDPRLVEISQAIATRVASLRAAAVSQTK